MKVEYDCYGIKSTTSLMFETFEDANMCNIGYEFLTKKKYKQMKSLLEFRNKRYLIDVPKHVELISNHVNQLVENDIDIKYWNDLYDYLIEFYKSQMNLKHNIDFYCLGFFTDIPEEYADHDILDYCKFEV